MIFDEATSGLDSKSENYIQDSIKSLSKESTCFIVAIGFQQLKMRTK